MENKVWNLSPIPYHLSHVAKDERLKFMKAFFIAIAIDSP